jgi:hypothetical protein
MTAMPIQPSTSQMQTAQLSSGNAFLLKCADSSYSIPILTMYHPSSKYRMKISVDSSPFIAPKSAKSQSVNHYQMIA